VVYVELWQLRDAIHAIFIRPQPERQFSALVSSHSGGSMRKSIFFCTILLGSFAVSAFAHDHDDDWDKSSIRHVLLISIDGMHAVDFLNCSQGIAGVNGGKPYCPNLTALGTTGVNYVAANTSILRALGLDSRQLDGVRLEGTSALPDVKFDFEH
jgi:hypothetical protein